MKLQSQDDVIKKFIQKHGDRYDYSLVNYTGKDNNVTIICREHGEFQQRAGHHYRGSNCDKCVREVSGKNQTLSLNVLLARFNKIHGDRYGYSLVIPTSMTKKITIICREHGEFQQQVSAHLRGSNCPNCANKKRGSSLISAQCIEKFKAAHGDTYDYTLVKYVSAHQHVKIRCKLHGEFQQQPYVHWYGSGCPKCKSLGFSQKAISWLEHISSQESIVIQHAMNSGEYKIPETRLKVDGYCKENNTVYEFLGDVWHGNPEVFNIVDTVHPFNDKTVEECYNDTMNRLSKIQNLGYNVIFVWENDWDFNSK